MVAVLLLNSCWKGTDLSKVTTEIELPPTEDIELSQFLVQLDRQAKEDPNSAIHHGRLAMAYDANGFVNQAIKAYENAALLDPSELRWPYLQALAVSQQGSIEDAVELMKRAIRLEPTYLPSYLATGYWLLDLGRFDEACDIFKEAEHTSGSDLYELPLLLGSIQCQFELGKHDIAFQLLDKLTISDLPPYAIRVRERVTRTTGTDNVIRDPSGHEQAEPMTWSDPIAGEVVEFTRGFAAESLLAQKLIDGGRAEDAVPLIKSLRSRYAQEPQLVELHSAALIELKRHTEAIEVLQAGLTQFEGEHLLHFNLALLYELVGRVDDALKELDRAIELEARFIEAYDAKTTLLINQENPQAAGETLQASLAFRAPSADSHYLLGVLYGGQGDWVQSIEQFTHAIKLRPDDAKNHASLALILSEVGRFEDALVAIQSAQILNPDDARVKQAIEILIANEVLESY